jgi:hypothetical protein
MKFSQVEFCAVLVGMLGKSKIGLVGGDEGRTRLESALGASVAEPLLLRVGDPRAVWVSVTAQ